MTTAPLSYTDKYAWGLRIEPTYDEMLQSVKRPLRIPIPSRAAKWYGLSVYRSLLLDAADNFQRYEQQKLDFERSNAALPQTAAAIRPSESGNDPAWARNERFNQDLEHQHEYERAIATMEAQHRAETAQRRREQLSAYGPTQGHWATEANRAELEEAGVPHMAPVARHEMPQQSWPTAHQVPVAAGILGGIPFPTFEGLNTGQQHRYEPASAAAASSNFSHRGYERLREQAALRE
jgi:hypothetical protein